MKSVIVNNEITLWYYLTRNTHKAENRCFSKLMEGVEGTRFS